MNRWHLLFLFLGAMALLSGFDFARNLDLKSLDSLHLPHRPHPDIVILAIDNASLTAIGRWPWDRKAHAEIIEKLKKYHPRAVAIDINFSEPQNLESDLALKQN